MCHTFTFLLSQLLRTETWFLWFHGSTKTKQQSCTWQQFIHNAHQVSEWEGLTLVDIWIAHSACVDVCKPNWQIDYASLVYEHGNLQRICLLWWCFRESQAGGRLWRAATVTGRHQSLWGLPPGSFDSWLAIVPDNRPDSRNRGREQTGAGKVMREEFSRILPGTYFWII